METLQKLKWFHFGQNNSGGFRVDDENVSNSVFIQDVSGDAAIARAEVFMDNSGSCPCCGDRWSFYQSDDGDDVPSIYGTPLTPEGGYGSKGKQWARLHYYDGRVEAYPPQELIGE
jgi:hypothetical protein